MTAQFSFNGYQPGALAAIIGLHAEYYAREWGFGLQFEAKVARELSDFVLRMKADNDLFLVARDKKGIAGSIIVDISGGGERGAHLRWFIVADRALGKGLGKALFDRAMVFCDMQGAKKRWLTSFSGLEAARGIYEQAGFAMTAETDEDQWHGGVREQLYEFGT